MQLIKINKSINHENQVSRGANDMMVAGKIEGLEDLQGGIANQVKVKGGFKGELLTR